MKVRCHILVMALAIFVPDASSAQNSSKAKAALVDTWIAARAQGRYLAAAEALRPLAFDAAGKPRPGFAYEHWTEAEALMTGEIPTPDTPDKPVTPDVAAKLRSATMRDAINEIVERARTTRVVILNEDHGVSRDRAFGLEVAHALRPLGYDVIAIETLGNEADDKVVAKLMAQLAAERYPHQTTGYYTTDPVFGDFLRQSLALGYRPVAYETTDQRPASDPDSDIAQREQAQADYLIARALDAYPTSKLFVYVGFHHAMEAPQNRDGKPTRWLAARLKAMTGIDPLTIDQTTIAEHPSDGDRAAYALLADRIGKRSVILTDGAKPLVVGDYADAVDLQVVHPPTRRIGGRPDWLLGMGRTPTPIPTALLPKTGTRLIQAFVAGEDADAVPVDQVLVTAGTPLPLLLLPAKAVRFAYQDPQPPR